VVNRTLRLSLSPERGTFAVTLQTDGGDSARAPFQFDFDPSSRIGSVIANLVTDARNDDLRDVGTQLLAGLLDGEVGTLFRRERDELDAAARAASASAAAAARDPGAAGEPEPHQLVIRLSVPPALQRLPWECLYDEQIAGFLLTQSRYCLIRDTAIRVEPRVPLARLPVSVLAVIPEGSGLSVEREMHGLKVAVDKLGDAITLERLDGAVTPDALRRALDSRQWDVVHFIGHGDVVNGLTRVRLNSENALNDGQWVSGEVFATFFDRHVPRLVILNCCHGGSQSTQRTLSGIGPFLLRAGVPAVVAMQFEIPDEVAIKFADSFYGELLGGPFRGRIDLALAAARRTLFQNQRPDAMLPFITPVLYLSPGHETLFNLGASAASGAPALAPQRAAAAPAVIVPQPAAPEIPGELIEALRERRCIPVVGPEILGVGMMRSASSAPGPRELAQKLADEAKYPRMDDFRFVDQVAEASGLWLLQTVCQHYEQEKERYKLLMAVQRAYKDFAPPPAAEAIASWDVPGIICTYFDGLIGVAMERQHRSVRVLKGVDQRLSGLKGETVLVHMRGIFNDGASLVLTESDHELLSDRMAKMSPEVTDLTRKQVGLSLLYLGVSPRDPIIRRLTRALRGGAGSAAVATQGPMYFACANHSAVDTAYWDKYNVEWLPLSLDDLLAAIAAAMPGGRA
jgi:hypothetical protein